MSISTELTRLQKAKTDIKAAIEAKGVTVPSNDRIDEYSTYISQISSGASLNIAYGNTAPSDTSKLWIKGDEAEKLTVMNLEQLMSLEEQLSQKAYGISSAAVGTKIYLFGGQASNSSYSDIIQCFDTTDNSISTLSVTLSIAASLIGVAAVGTKIYLFGGQASNSSYLKTIQCFDTTDNSISTLSVTLPAVLCHIGVAAVGTKIYLFGGRTSTYSDIIQCFDTTDNSISTLSVKLPSTLADASAIAVGTKIYLFGGRTSASRPSDIIQCFDTTDNSISTLSVTLPSAAYDISAAAVGTKIYLLGGYMSSYSDIIQCFDTTDNSISTLSVALTVPIARGTSSSIDTNIYLFGGTNTNGASNTITQFLTEQKLDNNNILLVTDYKTNVFNLLTNPTQVKISIKKVYRGNSSNVAELNDAYLYNGSVWLNVNE